MVKLTSLKKEAKNLTKGTSLAGYINTTFIRVAERDFLLLQHLPTEVRGKVLQLAQENCSLHISADPDEISDLTIASIVDHKPGQLWLNFGFFSKTISGLISPKYPLNDWGKNSELWSKFWEVHDLKLDFFEEQFSNDQDSINVEGPAFTEEFFLPGTWSSGIDKNTREFIINFLEWGEVIYYFDNINSKPARKNRWILMERVKKQFLDKKIDFPTAQAKTKPVMREELPQQADLVQKLTDEQLNPKNEISTSWQNPKFVGILFEEYRKNAESQMNQECIEKVATNEMPDKLKDLIKKFAEEFSKNTSYSANAIEIYIRVWEEKAGLNFQRARAKRVAIPQNNELKDIYDGTLSNWEKNWTEYRSHAVEK